LTRSEALTDAERTALRPYPLVVAQSVQTPGNVNLMQVPPSSTPVAPKTP